MAVLLYKYLMNSINISIFIVLMLLLQPFLKRHFSAICLYRIWAVLLIALLLPMRIEFTKSLFRIHLSNISSESEVSGYLHMQDSIGSDLSLSNINLIKDSSSKEQINSNMDLPNRFKNIITFLMRYRITGICLIWIIGIFFSLLKNTLRYRKYIKQVKRFLSPVIDKDVLIQFEKCKTEINYYYKSRHCIPIYQLSEVKICRCSILTDPMSFGILKPVIVLPEEPYSNKDLRFLLLHELIHIHRHDTFIKLLRLLVVSIHWFNPFCYLLSRHVESWCEIACDEIVLHRSSKSECIEYCKLLLKCALSQTEPRTTLITSFCGGKHNMKNRMLSIMNQAKRRPGRLLLALIAGIVSTTVIISVGNYNNVLASDKMVMAVNVKPATVRITEKESNTESKNTAAELRKEIVSFAVDSQYVPYLWGGNDLSTGVDCSGLVQALYKKLDYDLPRTSREQWKECVDVSIDSLLPGDLIFYNNSNDSTINHVAIYIGDKKVIHAKNYKVGVTIEDIDYRKPYKAGRIIADE